MHDGVECGHAHKCPDCGTPIRELMDASMHRRHQEPIPPFAPADLQAGDVVTWKQCWDRDTLTGLIEVSLLAPDPNGNIAYTCSGNTICPKCSIIRVERDGREVFPRRPVETLDDVQRERDLFRRQRDDFKRRLEHVANLLEQGVKEARK